MNQNIDFCELQSVVEICKPSDHVANAVLLQHVLDKICCLNFRDNTYGILAQRYCVGDTLLFFAGEGESWQWSGPNSWSSTSQNPTIPDIDLSHSGLYQVEITSEDGCITTFYVQVIVATCDTGSGSDEFCFLNPVHYCVGDLLFLESNYILQVGDTIEWTGPDGFVSTDAVPTISNVQLVNAGEYTYTVTNGGMDIVIKCQYVNVVECPNLYILDTPQGIISPPPGYPAADPALHDKDLYINRDDNTTESWDDVNSVWVDHYTIPCPVAEDVSAVVSNPDLPNVAVAEIEFWITGNGPFAAGSIFFVIGAGASYAPEWVYYLECDGTVTQIKSKTPLDATIGVTARQPINKDDTVELYSELRVLGLVVGGTTYAWEGPGGYVSAAQNPTRTPAVGSWSGLYRCIGTIPSGEKAFGMVYVTVNDISFITGAGSIGGSLGCDWNIAPVTTNTCPGEFQYTYRILSTINCQVTIDPGGQFWYKITEHTLAASFIYRMHCGDTSYRDNTYNLSVDTANFNAPRNYYMAGRFGETISGDLREMDGALCVSDFPDNYHWPHYRLDYQDAAYDNINLIVDWHGPVRYKNSKMGGSADPFDYSFQYEKYCRDSCFMGTALVIVKELDYDGQEAWHYVAQLGTATGLNSTTQINIPACGGVLTYTWKTIQSGLTLVGTPDSYNATLTIAGRYGRLYAIAEVRCDGLVIEEFAVYFNICRGELKSGQSFTVVQAPLGTPFSDDIISFVRPCVMLGATGATTYHLTSNPAASGGGLSEPVAACGNPNTATITDWNQSNGNFTVDKGAGWSGDICFEGFIRCMADNGSTWDGPNVLFTLASFP